MKLSEQIPKYPKYIDVRSKNYWGRGNSFQATLFKGEIRIGSIKAKMSSMGKVKIKVPATIISVDGIDSQYELYDRLQDVSTAVSAGPYYADTDGFC